MTNYEFEQFKKLAALLELSDVNEEDLGYVMMRAAVRIERLHDMAGLDWVLLSDETIPEKGQEHNVLGAAFGGGVYEVASSRIRELWADAKKNDEQCFYTHWKSMPSHPTIPRNTTKA